MESVIHVRTLRGDLFEFPSGTTENDIVAHLATEFEVEASQVRVRSITNQNSAAAATATAAAKDILEYIAVIDLDSDPTVYFLPIETINDSETYEVRTTPHLGLPYLPNGFWIRKTDTDMDTGIQWSIEGPDRGWSENVYPKLKLCIEDFCQITGWPLPSTLFLKRIGLHFHWASIVHPLTHFANQENPAKDALYHCRYMHEVHQDLLAYDPTIDWRNFADDMWIAPVEEVARQARTERFRTICQETGIDIMDLVEFLRNGWWWVK